MGWLYVQVCVSGGCRHHLTTYHETMNKQPQLMRGSGMGNTERQNYLKLRLCSIIKRKWFWSGLFRCPNSVMSE